MGYEDNNVNARKENMMKLKLKESTRRLKLKESTRRLKQKESMRKKKLSVEQILKMNKTININCSV